MFAERQISSTAIIPLLGSCSSPRTMTVTITLTAEQARPVRQARSIGDDSALRALLDVHITEQVDWSGELDRTFHTDVIESISYQE